MSLLRVVRRDDRETARPEFDTGRSITSRPVTSIAEVRAIVRYGRSRTPAELFGGRAAPRSTTSFADHYRDFQNSLLAP